MGLLRASETTTATASPGITRTLTPRAEDYPAFRKRHRMGIPLDIVDIVKPSSVCPSFTSARVLSKTLGAEKILFLGASAFARHMIMAGSASME
jgi:hypothetical protein